jgi:hypothetical protein
MSIAYLMGFDIAIEMGHSYMYIVYKVPGCHSKKSEYRLYRHTWKHSAVSCNGFKSEHTALAWKQ